jgi:hypothetical protein
MGTEIDYGAVLALNAELWMFASDALMPAQFYARRPAAAPEHRLLYALLEDALRVVQRVPVRGYSQQRSLSAWDDAYLWLVDTTSTHPFSLSWVCEMLGVDAETLAQRVREKQIKVAAHRIPSSKSRRIVSSMVDGREHSDATVFSSNLAPRGKWVRKG